MKINVTSFTYNTGGPGVLLWLIGPYLEMQLNEYGNAIKSIEVWACFRSSERPLKPLEDLFVRFNSSLDGLPRITFDRRRAQVKIRYETKVPPEEIGRIRLTSKKFNTGFAEICALLPMIVSVLKKTDEFDVERFVADVHKAASKRMESDATVEALEEEVVERRRAALEGRTEWERLDIDWDEYDPQAKEKLNDPFFWREADDNAPHGNDTGADVLAEYRKWVRAKGEDAPEDFLESLVRNWGFSAPDWLSTDEVYMRERLKEAPNSLPTCDDAAIALAFACIKLSGQCSSIIKSMAQAAIIREQSQTMLEHRGWRDLKERQATLAVMDEKLRLV